MRIINGSDVSNLIITGVLSAIIGGSGIVGIVFYFIRRYIENRLDSKAKEQALAEKVRKDEENKKKELRVKRKKVDDELQHCEGRLFFWIHKAIVDGEHNGDLENAFREYQTAETNKKDLDREIVAEQETE